MAKFSKPWTVEWLEIENLGAGGQGSAKLVRRASASESPPYALKVLTRQNDPERRGRMYREVAALRTLNHDGIPKLIETNADLFADQSVGLYLVSEYIPGQGNCVLFP